MKADKPSGDSFWRELGKIAVPVAFQNLMTALVGASDAFMLGRLSQEAVAAVSLSNQVAFVMHLFIMAVIGGGGALLAQYYGKGDKKTVSYVFCATARYAMAISLIFFLLAQVIPEGLMRIYTDDAGLIAIGSSYLRIVSWSYLFNGAAQCWLMAMKVCGRAKKSAVISVMTVVVDMTADAFLIYGLCGIPAMGANGSAVSTVLVELAALLWVIYDSRKGELLTPRAGDWMRFVPALEGDLWRVSGPMLVSWLVWGVGFSMQSMVTGHLGADAAAAASIAAVTRELVTCVDKGLSSGTAILLGYRLGRGQMEEAKTLGAKMCRVSLLCGGANAIAVCALIPLMCGFFLLSEAAESYLVFMLLVTAVYSFAHAVNSIVVNGIFISGGDSRYDAVTVFVFMWCLCLPLALAGTFVLHWPVKLIYLIVCADEIIKTLCIYPRYKKYIWLKNMTRETAL